MVILSELPDRAIYDVFLSFRGKDTRHSFTDHLRKALQDANINTFLDNEVIQTGENLRPELETAINASSASIIVFSENYASSTWCLDELVLILEQHRTSNHVVIPVFYHVEPTDVRKQQSSYGEALAKHKHMLEAETDPRKKSQRARKIEGWQMALEEVANLKGMNVNGWLETEFIEEIVKDTSSRLDLHLQSKIPHLIGMRSLVETVTSWLKDGATHTADILTIWGMGGIGKTSLAKYIYQLHYVEFARRSFIEDIERRCTPVSSLLDLQKHLLEDIQKGNLLKLQDVDMCTIKIEKALLSNRTLLVLDGIDNFQQLDVLIGTKGFHPGSKIIITTKDGSLTEKCGLFNANVLPRHMKVLHKGLYEFESLQLLSWYAFRCNDPKEEYKEECMKVVKHCKGHPLALKVLGSSLRNEDVVAWEDTVELLDKEPNPNIQKVIQISFDSLPSENDKELFKHIACFFVGKDREFTEIILKECGIRTTFGFTKLIDRCLIKVGRRNELKMHQLLQDMGRYLVYQESPHKPWKRSRLWRHEESYDVLKQEKGTTKIQGIVLDMKMEEIENQRLREKSSSIQEIFGDGHHDKSKKYNFLFRFWSFFSRIWSLFNWIFLLCSSHRKKPNIETIALSKMDNLRILQLNYVQLHGSYKHFPKGIRWLSMHGFPLSYIHSDIHMDSIVSLDMSNSNLQQLWKHHKVFRSMKILNLSSSKIVRMGDFSRLPALERLILARCGGLIEVCESIGECSRLVLLDLSYCNKLKRLPTSIRKLKKVRTLLIDGCSSLDEFPKEIKDMASLQVLNASEINTKAQDSLCVAEELLPRRVKSLSLLFPCSLVSLSLRNNNLFNESFPLDFSSLSKLRVLNLSKNPITSLPDCVKSLRTLEYLCLQGCNSLNSISCVPSTIEFLDANQCPMLEKISFHPDFFIPYHPSTSNPLEKTIIHRPKISFLSSESLTEIEGIRKLQPLAQVDEEILRNLGWGDLEDVKTQQLQVFDAVSWGTPKKLHVQMFYEIGIFSMCFPGKNIPEWVTHKSNGSSISLTIPWSTQNIRGINVGYVYTTHGVRGGDWQDYIRNRTKKRKWVYEPYLFYVVSPTDDDKNVVCVRHWVIGKNEMEGGDKIDVHILPNDHFRKNVTITQCGVSFVYEDGLAIYKPWKYKIGSGGNFDGIEHHCYRHFTSPPPDRFELATTHQFVGYITQNKHMNKLRADVENHEQA